MPRLLLAMRSAVVHRAAAVLVRLQHARHHRRRRCFALNPIGAGRFCTGTATVPPQPTTTAAAAAATTTTAAAETTTTTITSHHNYHRRRRIHEKLPPRQFPFATQRLVPQPKGVLLLITAWNFPVDLVFNGLSQMLAAGNCVVVKPSEVSRNCEQLFEKLIPECVVIACARVRAGACWCARGAYLFVGACCCRAAACCQ